MLFDEACFPLRDKNIHQIPADDLDESDDDPSINITQPSATVTTPPTTPTPNNSIETHIHHSPAPPNPTPSRPVRTQQPIQRYGNVVSYAAVTKRVPDDDNPTYYQAMSGPEKDKWRAAMQVEFDSLVSCSVFCLIPRPKSAKMLGGMWRFKQKSNTSGNVTKYKARWVILGNHQIHGIDYFET